MKRKFIQYLFIGLAALTFAGCGNTADTASDDEEIIEDADDEDEDEDEDDEDEDEGDDRPEEEASASNVILSRDATSNVIFVIDPDGNVSEISRKDLAENISASDRDVYRVSAEEQYLQSALAGEGDGFYFFKDANYSEKTGEYVYLVYAVSEDDHKLYPIWEDSDSHYIETCEYYDGCLYVDFNLGYDYDNDQTLGVEELCFEYDEKSDSFKEKDTEYASVLEAARSKNMRLIGSRSGGWDYPDCYTRSLREYGYILGNTDDGYAIINEKGVIQLLSGIEDAYISFYDKDHLFYAVSDYGSNLSSVYVYDITDGNIKTLASDVEGTTFLGKDGGKIYYLTGSYEEYGIAHEHIYEYDFESGDNKLLYEAKSIPGVSLAYPGAEGFTVADGKIYIIDFEDGDLKWVYADVSDGKADFKDLYCFVEHVDIFDYGTVEYASYSYACPDCGTVLNQRYAECFVLDDKYSDNADIINEYMHTNMETFVNDNFLESDSYYDSSCEDHQPNPTWYRVTDDWNVSGVAFIGDKYLTVNMGGYWYGGGAHGYPSRNQYLFDLETGEEMSIADFYSGKEKDFKTLVADKTIEYYRSLNEDMNPFYTADEDTIYSDAYENAFLDDGNIEYTEDGIYYFYPPYIMGPYAAGYIDIFIPYDELLGRDSL